MKVALNYAKQRNPNSPIKHKSSGWYRTNFKTIRIEEFQGYKKSVSACPGAGKTRRQLPKPDVPRLENQK